MQTIMSNQVNKPMQSQHWLVIHKYTEFKIFMRRVIGLMQRSILSQEVVCLGLIHALSTISRYTILSLCEGRSLAVRN